jgi:hypothetical protein
MGYHKYSDDIRVRALEVLQEHGGAMQNHELAKIALAEGWAIHHKNKWGTHGILNTLREDGIVIKVRRGRYALFDSAEAVASPATAWERMKARIKQTTRGTVSSSGKTVQRVLKNKQLRCDDLDATLDRLWKLQKGRCRQTGVAFVEDDPDLRASLDRIDSDGHYADGSVDDDENNLQLVTHWYNIAKGTRSDAEMRQLILRHAGALRVS